MTREEYIAKYKGLATYTTQDTGLFPSVMLAQAIVESNNGNSVLASKYNNHFGIKAQNGDGWNGKKANLQSNEVVDGNNQMQGSFFRVYNNVRDSYNDRIIFLKRNTRYKNTGVFTAATPMAQLQALQSAGYATDPEYAQIIDQVLENNNLKAQDTTLAFIKNNMLAITITVSALIGIVFLLVHNKKSIIQTIN